MTRTPL